tara:strand:- start:92 stop:415 length:324 start_codon:yes stop_codon:yes gene_type:complete
MIKMTSYPVKRFEEFVDRLANGQTVRIEYDRDLIHMKGIELFPREIDETDLRSMAEFLEYEADKFERLRFSVDGGEQIFKQGTSINAINEYWKTQSDEDYDEALSGV